MIKCFLSHSSKNKKDYVDVIARKMDKENLIYDAHSFEEGMGNLEEIMKGLGSSDLFVLFLSNDSLDSEWVKKEIIQAKNLYDNGFIKRIFPVLIDKSINHKDKRIPEWMRKEYNIKPIGRPTVALRRIKQRMREISWDFHPKIKEKEQIFVGRNELLSLFEERIDDFNRRKPSCIVAGGLESIGRRTFLKKAFEKANIIDASYDFPIINLEQQDSLEDFILKIYDLGFSEERDLTDFINKPIDDKVGIAAELLIDIQNIKERLLIIDNGCVVGYDRDGSIPCFCNVT